MAEVPPLVAEATKKSGLVWIAVPGIRFPAAAWHVWRDDAAYLVVGPGEQPVPGLTDASACAVTVRSTDKGGRIVTWRAEVSRVEPDTEQWREVVPTLLAARLNLTDSSDAEQRWAETCAVLRLAPTGELLEAGDSLPTDSHATPPQPTPARTPTPIPHTVGRNGWRRVRRRGRGQDPGRQRG